MPNIFVDTTPVLDPDRPGVATSVITDAWGLFFAQGGVVMAAALRAMERVLDREDLALASASATFCRPVACGPVTTSVQVLRNGRRGAQVLGWLRDQTAPEGETSVAVTAVFTNPDLPGPTLTPLPLPDELRVVPPPDSPTDAISAAAGFPLGFLDNTVWHIARSPEPVIDRDAPVPRVAVWFRFADPPASDGLDWDPALLPIPGDALGSALAAAFEGGDAPVGSTSLQIDMQVVGPISGTWIGIDSRLTHVGNGLASGVLELWSAAGTRVATVTQTAMLRSIGD